MGCSKLGLLVAWNCESTVSHVFLDTNFIIYPKRVMKYTPEAVRIKCYTSPVSLCARLIFKVLA